VLHIANIVQNHTDIAVQACQFARQPQVTFGRQQSLHQRSGTAPIDRLSLADQCVPECGGYMALASAWFADCNHVDRLLHKRAAAQSVNLLGQEWAKRAQLQLLKGFLAR
jgi:hypothetical protein